MMNGLRKTFWSSIHKKKNIVDDDDSQKPTSTKFGFFSNPSTPRSETRPGSSSTLRCHTWSTTSVANATPSPSSSLPASPKLHCRTSGDITPTTTPTTPTTPRRNRSPLSILSVSPCSTPSSTKSPGSFSLFKSKLCFTKSGGSSRCGICLQSVKAGRGTAIFSAECSHTFHFPCVASRSGDRNLLAECPVCGVSWRETSVLPPPLSLHELKSPTSGSESDYRIRESSKGGNKSLRVYNDDEALITSPMSPGGFNTIPESDENDEDEEEDNGDFKGFFVNTPSPLTLKKHFTEYSVSGHVDVKLSTDAAIVAVGKGNETYSVVMKIKSPSLPAVTRRSPVDLVTVLDVSGGKTETVKKAMKLVISSLRETDRLSMVSFSSSSKRLTPLRRMTANGRRIARRIVDEISGDGDGMSVHDAVKKAAKVIEDRRQKNLFATIFVLTDRKAHQAQLAKSDFVSSTRFSHLEIPTHTIWLSACNHALPEDALAKQVKSLLSLSVQDLTLNLGLVSGSGQGEITAAYSLSGRPVWLGSGSGSIRLGDMYGEEVREVLVELKSPTSGKSHRIMTVRSRHVDPTTQEIRNSEDRALLMPRPITVRSSSTTNIGRLRNLHVSTRAVAESRRLIEANDYSGAERMLTSARALLVQYGLTSSDACLRGLDAELADLNRIRGRQVTVKSPEPVAQKAEPLTPTTAWRAAERLAKVAIMRKHMNRVSDLHGFENARF